MAEYNNQRFYWIKLSDRFMTSDTVDFLMEQKDGANYVVLYQMLCLKSVNNNGELARRIGEVIIPYDEEKIQRDCKWFSIDTVRVALNLYKKLGLIYAQDDGILKIADFDRLIGSQTISAEKKQLQRSGGVDKCPPICPPDKDIEKDIEKEKDNITFTYNKRVRACEQLQYQFNIDLQVQKAINRLAKNEKLTDNEFFIILRGIKNALYLGCFTPADFSFLVSSIECDFEKMRSHIEKGERNARLIERLIKDYAPFN